MKLFFNKRILIGHNLNQKFSVQVEVETFYVKCLEESEGAKNNCLRMKIMLNTHLIYRRLFFMPILPDN